MGVRVLNKHGEWLTPQRTWTPRRDKAMRFRTVEEAERELERVMLEWLGQVIFDVTADG